MFPNSRAVLFSLVLTAFGAVPLGAQSLDAQSYAAPAHEAFSRPVAADARQAPVGPAIAMQSVAARPARAEQPAGDTELAPMQRARFSNAQTLMIVGGAAFVAGALIGDDAGTVVMIGGAVVGLYGLYLYLQQ